MSTQHLSAGAHLAGQVSADVNGAVPPPQRQAAHINTTISTDEANIGKSVRCDAAAIEERDVVAMPQCLLGDVATNKARPAEDKKLHDLSLFKRTVRHSHQRRIATGASGH